MDEWTVVALTTAIEVGIVIEPRAPIRQVAEQAQLAENSGYDFIGIADGQMIYRDLSAALTASMMATSRILLGPWVTNPITRHPTVTANFICTLDELSQGRVFLGIGNGDNAVRTIGATPAAMAALAETVQHMRDLMDGREVPMEGVGWRLSTASARQIPIYWAGANPRSLQHGARHCDGLIISGFLDEAWLAEIIASVHETPRGKGLKLIFNSAVSIDDDGDRARDAARSYVAGALRYKSSARLQSWSDADVKRMRSAYDSYHHFRETNEAAVALVPDSMIPKKSIAGTPEECAELMELVIMSGITNFGLIPMGDIEKTIDLLATRVRPLVEQRLDSGPENHNHGCGKQPTS